MAVLEKLRNRAGILLAVVIGLALFGFILQDLFTSGGSIGRSGDLDIGKIGRHSITYQDYQKKIDDLMRIYQITGNTNMDEATLESIREQTWQRLVREEILEKEYEKLGIDVTPDELFEMIQGARPHPMIQQLFTDPQTGMFNRQALFSFLRNMDMDPNQKAYWLFLENELTEERKYTKYTNLISKGLYVPGKLAEITIQRRSKMVDFDYVTESFTSVPDSLVTVTASDVKDYYEKHRHNYRQEATRDIEYVVFSVKPSNSDVRAVEKWIEEIKPEFESVEEVEQFISLNSDQRYTGRNYKNGELPSTINDFMFQAEPGDVYGPYFEDEAYKLARLMEINYLPDSVKARHILIEPDRTIPYEEAMAEARKMADSLKTLIENGTDFASLAEEYSADQGSAMLGGNLGWFTEGTMIQEFSDACFNGRPGDLTIVETQYGIHLIEIQEHGPRVKKVKVAVLARNLEPSSTTYQNVYTDASRFAANHNTYEKFNRAVEDENVTKRIASDIRKNDKTIAGLANPRPLIRAAFQTDEEKIILDVNNQAVFELDDQFVVGFVTRARKEGFTPLEDVRSEIEFNVRKQKKAKIITERMQEALEGSQNITDLAGRLGTTVKEATGITFASFSIPGGGIEPAVIATAIETEEGEMSGPVTGNNGVYVLEVKNVVDASGIDLATNKNQLMRSYQTRASYEVFEALKEITGVKDNRYKYF